VDYASDGRNVDQSVQRLPAFSAQTPDPSCGGGKSERNQQYKRGEADGDEFALGDISQNLVQVEKFIQPDVSKEVQTAIEKGEQSEHPAKPDEPRNPKQLSNGGNGKSDE